MSWAYRVLVDRRMPVSQPDFISIAEVFFDDAGQPNGYADATGPCGETEGEFAKSCKLFHAAVNEPWFQVTKGPKGPVITPYEKECQ